VQEMLGSLKEKQIPMAVVSNKPHHFTTEICGAMFPEGTFTCVMGQKDEVPKKPAPDPVWNCLKEMGVSKCDAVYIGDSTVDIQTARKAELIPVAVSWGYHDEPALLEMQPEHFVRDTVELKEKLIELQ